MDPGLYDAPRDLGLLDVRDLIPKGLASWPSTLRFLRRKSGDLWPPFTILLIALYCMYVY